MSRQFAVQKLSPRETVRSMILHSPSPLRPTAARTPERVLAKTPTLSDCISNASAEQLSRADQAEAQLGVACNELRDLKAMYRKVVEAHRNLRLEFQVSEKKRHLAEQRAEAGEQKLATCSCFASVAPTERDTAVSAEVREDAKLAHRETEALWKAIASSVDSATLLNLRKLDAESWVAAEAEFERKRRLPLLEALSTSVDSATFASVVRSIECGTVQQPALPAVAVSHRREESPRSARTVAARLRLAGQSREASPRREGTPRLSGRALPSAAGSSDVQQVPRTSSVGGSTSAAWAGVAAADAPHPSADCDITETVNLRSEEEDDCQSPASAQLLREWAAAQAAAASPSSAEVAAASPDSAEVAAASPASEEMAAAVCWAIQEKASADGPTHQGSGKYSPRLSSQFKAPADVADEGAACLSSQSRASADVAVLGAPRLSASGSHSTAPAEVATPSSSRARLCGNASGSGGAQSAASPGGSAPSDAEAVDVWLLDTKAAASDAGLLSADGAHCPAPTEASTNKGCSRLARAGFTVSEAPKPNRLSIPSTWASSSCSTPVTARRESTDGADVCTKGETPNRTTFPGGFIVAMPQPGSIRDRIRAFENKK